MRHSGLPSVAVALFVAVGLLAAGCGSDSESKSDSTTTTKTTAKTGTTTTAKKPAQPLYTKTDIAECLSKDGIKTGKTFSGKANDIKGTARLSFSGKFAGSKYGALVEDVAFLIYVDRDTAAAARRKLKDVPKKNLIFNSNLIVVTGKRNQKMKKLLISCVSINKKKGSGGKPKEK